MLCRTLCQRLWIPTNRLNRPALALARFMSEETKIPRPGGMGSRSSRDDPMKNKGPVSWVNLAVSGAIVASVIGTYLYVKSLKTAELEKERKREIGKSKIGGPFSLVDQEGKTRTNQDFLGKWVLIYFGFSHCPDICPDEMEKMALAYNTIMEDRKKDSKNIDEIVPLFITVDPERDSPKVVKEYVQEFDPNIIGLTGNDAQIKEACKSYRVYYSAGPRDDDEDYIVDHTIIIYLVDPEGNFVDYYGQRKTGMDIAESAKLHMMKFKRAHQKSWL